MNVILKNKIEDKIKEYQQNTGTTRKWIINKLGMSSSRFYVILNTNNLTIDVVARFALFLNCKIDDLFEYKAVD